MHCRTMQNNAKIHYGKCQIDVFQWLDDYKHEVVDLNCYTQ